MRGISRRWKRISVKVNWNQCEIAHIKPLPPGHTFWHVRSIGMFWQQQILSRYLENLYCLKVKYRAYGTPEKPTDQRSLPIINLNNYKAFKFVVFKTVTDTV